MNSYTSGFFTKCAECGLDYGQAVWLYKIAQQGVASTVPAPVTKPVAAPAAPAKPTAAQAQPQWKAPSGLSRYHQAKYDQWSGLNAQQQYAVLQKANSQQKALLSQWTSPERQAEIRRIHALQKQQQEFDRYRRATGGVHPDEKTVRHIKDEFGYDVTPEEVQKADTLASKYRSGQKVRMSPEQVAMATRNIPMGSWGPTW